jgi:hypothetical protein
MPGWEKSWDVSLLGLKRERSVVELTLVYCPKDPPCWAAPPIACRRSPT